MTEVELGPVPQVPEPRSVKWLRILGVIALVEAIMLMTGTLVVGFLLFVAGVSLVGNLGDSQPRTGGTDVATVPEGVPPEGSGETPAAGPKVLKIGQTGTVLSADTGQEVVRITLSAQRFTTGRPNEFSDPPAEKFFLHVVVLAQATGSQQVSVDPSQFYFRLPSGDRFNSGEGNASGAVGNRALASTTLNPGEKVRGEVVFDVPSKAGDIVYDEGGGAAVVWRL